jgi:hypothetical protein
MINRIIRNTVLYLLLILGYCYLYLSNIEALVYPEEEVNPQSKVDFIYQQF